MTESLFFTCEEIDLNPRNQLCQSLKLWQSVEM